MNYDQYLARKLEAVAPAPAPLSGAPSDELFPFQRAIVEWALERGRAAVFADCGLGKTLMQLEWARHVAAATGRQVLTLAPLAVAQQTVAEGRKFGIEAAYAREQADVADAPVVITNYERVERFDPEYFGGVVLDESSILKSFMGKTKRHLMEAFRGTAYRLCCTATPAPNDHLELGNHAEFLGVLTSHEMIARWFINDTSTFGTYRLKHHAVRPFWRWVCSWARCAGLPSDLGDFSDDGYRLPELEIEQHVVETDLTHGRTDTLFRMPGMSATDAHREKRLSAGARAARIAELVAADPDEPWLVWCETDYEADALRDAIPDAVDVRGSMSLDAKEAALGDFVAGRARVLVTKPKIAGYGLNFQHCARVAFVGPTWSYESYYQAIRRVWRFGQQRPVRVHVTMAWTEIDVWNVMLRKASDHDAMKANMFAAAREAQAERSFVRGYHPENVKELPAWIRTQ